MFCIILIQCVLFNIAFAISRHPILIVVSYDAFRYNYFEKNCTQFMDKLRKEGTYADYLINVFPTKTFPNHHSIATGVFTEVHGVVSNSLYDPVLKEVIDTRSPEMFTYSDDVIPIWTLNELSGDDRYSGSMMWPGGEFQYHNKTITYANKWDTSYDWYKRIDTVISWIKNPTKPANLVMLYYEEPDLHSHMFGPDSDTVYNILQRIDNITRYLDEQIKRNNLENYVNVIHLSDHGISSVPLANIIDITKDLKPDTYRLTGTSPCLNILPDSDLIEDVYQRLRNTSKENGHFTVYKKEDLPERWHFKNNRRTPPIFALADNGYGFQDLNETMIKYYIPQYHIKADEHTRLGVHGYDNDVKDMHPFFMARGPAIRSGGHRVPPFHTVDLYNLFAAVLGVRPIRPTNGTFANVRDILVSQSGNAAGFANGAGFSTVGVVVGALIVALMLVSCGAVATLLMIRRQQNITTAAALNKRFPQTFSNTTTSNVVRNFGVGGVEAQHLLDAEDA